MYKPGDAVRAEDGTFYVVEDVFPYEPANYVNEEYLLLCRTAKQVNTQSDEEYPIYSLGGSGLVEIQMSESAKWEVIGKWDPKDNRLSKCEKCGSDLHYEGTYGAPGVGQSWKCDNGHYWSKLGRNFYDPSDGSHILDESDVI